MAYTQADVDALERAIASGVKEVQYADKSVKYRSLAEMRSVLAEMKRALGTAQPARQVRVYATKGW